MPKCAPGTSRTRSDKGQSISRSPPYLVQARQDATRLSIPEEGYQAFAMHFRNARRRDIGWEFTLPEWWDWWQTDGRWARRGRNAESLQMARFNDAGPYSPSNVYCTTLRGNQADFSSERRSAIRKTAILRHIPTYQHLRDRERHPGRQPVSSPHGDFPSITLAAEALGLTVATIKYRLKRPESGWRRAAD